MLEARGYVAAREVERAALARAGVQVEEEARRRREAEEETARHIRKLHEAEVRTLRVTPSSEL